MSVAAGRAAPALSEPELAAWRGLLRAHATLVRTLDAELERAHGLPLSSFEVLRALEAAPARRLRMCEVASTALLSRSGITRLVDRLERDGLVVREGCEADARGAFAVLTDAGAARLLAARATHIEGIRRHFASHFTVAELEALGRCLARLGPCSPPA